MTVAKTREPAPEAQALRVVEEERRHSRELAASYVLAVNRGKEASAALAAADSARLDAEEKLAALTAGAPDPQGRPDLRYLGGAAGLHLCKLSTRALEALQLLGMTEEA